MNATQKYGYTIKRVKTLYGYRWAVVDAEGFTVTVDNKLAMFPNDKEGLAEAQKVYASLKAQAVV